jgi:hypothetical protein
MNPARFPPRAQVAATALLIALSAGCGGGHPHPAGAAASTASGDAGADRELSFRSGPDTLPATLTPRMLVLAGLLGRRCLDVLARQLTDQYRRAQAVEQLSAKDAAARIADLKRIIAILRATGKPPAHLADPALAPALNPVPTFLIQADRLDPAQLARRLGPSLPVLVLRGTKDVQADSGDVDHLMQGLTADRSAVRADIPDADHLFKVVTRTPNPPVDYANAGRPFAPQVAPRPASFLALLR